MHYDIYHLTSSSSIMSSPRSAVNVQEIAERRPSTILSRCWRLLKTRHGLWLVTALYANLGFSAILGLALHFSGHLDLALTVVVPSVSFVVLPGAYWAVMLAALPGGALRGGLSFVGVFFLHALTHHFVREGWWESGAYSAWALSLASVAKFMDHEDKCHVIKGTGVSFGQAFIGVALRPAERDWLVLLMFALVALYSLLLYLKDNRDRDSSYQVAKKMLKGGASTLLTDQFPNA